MALIERVEPNGMLVDFCDALQPQAARLLVHVLDRAAGDGDLVRAHRRVADEDDLVVGGIGIQHLPSVELIDERTAPTIASTIQTAISITQYPTHHSSD